MKLAFSHSSLRRHGFLAIVGLAASTSAFAQISIGVTTTPFTDISSTGTSIGLMGDDVEINLTSAQLSAAGFAGNQLLPLTNVRVGNNGALLWNNTGSEVGWNNSLAFATMAASNAVDTGNGGSTVGTSMLCPLWDDGVPVTGQESNAVRWQVVGGNLIVQWSNEAHYGITANGFVQFQAIIYGGATIGSGSPLVDFVYNDTFYQASTYPNDGGSATIGYKNWSTVAAANDVEYGVPGGNATVTDPIFGDPTMHPKVAGYASNNDPTLPHALRIRGAATYVSFCPGDGSGTACPCGNNAPMGAGGGCLSSLGNSALLAGAGSASISNDTFTLNGSLMPNSSALYFQGTAQTASGAGSVFGDGLRCAGGTVIRLGTKTNVGGSSSYPNGSTPISIKGADAAGNVRTYQCWYRNAAAFCSPSTFNLTNGLQATWSP